jgi:FMN phosphatase YigB (HAD superfamily)
MNTQIQAILFDLDGTLLDNDMATLLPYYFRLLGARVAHHIAPDEFMDHLIKASDAMIANDGRATNEEVFVEVFYDSTGLPRDELEPVFVDFYANDFPTLRRYTRPKPEARPVVQMAFDLGFDVVIATNPVFPATAVQQRLAWAGVDGLPYRRVTSFENSRAAKPNLRYFEEILDDLGLPASAVMVVGDENMDMVAAHLGCKTFLVPGPRTELAPKTPSPDYSGTLADVGALLQSWR